MSDSEQPTTRDLNSERLIFGCMWLGGGWEQNSISANDIREAHAVIDAALEIGVRRFDHADIYKSGRAEQVFGEVLKQRPRLRKEISIQSKCGIRFADEHGPQRYDFSTAWILQSVDGILQRLGIEQLDCLLLHRPDPLIQPDEVAEAFDQLTSTGKVASFGVSNMHHYQITHLQSQLQQKLVANQLEMSLKQHAWLDEGVYAGDSAAATASFSPGTVEFCVAEGIEIQSWGSLCRGLYSGLDVSGESEAVQQTAKLVSKVAEKYQTTREAILLAWLFLPPANISAVIGSTKAKRIKSCADATTVRLSRDDWYALYVSARGKPIP
ncbi:MAG: aldo/keto reductase [Pseudomonadota bacterium]